MGEVYRATDTKLGREVAIKALPGDVAQDTERLARFRREAQVLASLNHPNVGAIHGLEEVEGQSYLVLELVEGEDLSQRLARGRLSVDEALEIAGQIAEALEAAHEQGIVHRDLKPANVKLADDGKVKVLDFGLAKAWAVDTASGSSADLSQSPTLAHTGTLAGAILGTAAYMSPEQARGRRVDKRADVWSFGVVLFEMLAGCRLFEGETASEILASVIKDEPDWSALPPETPSRVVEVLRRCLAREPRQRLHDVADARLLLQDAGTTEPVAAGPTTPRWREGLAWLVAALALGAAATTWWKPATRAPTEPLIRFTVSLPTEQPLAFADVPVMALSPDGRTLAFAAIASESGQSMIHLRALESAEPWTVPGTEGGNSPFFSPDGRSIAFFGDGRLKKVPIGGGTPLALADAPTWRGGVWAEDGTIFYSPEYTSGLWRVSSAGGAPELVVDVDTENRQRTYRWPDVLPGGRTVLFTIGTLDSPNDFSDAQVAAYSLDGGELRVLVDGASMARFVAPRTLVYSRGGILYAVPFDPDRAEVLGEPRPVLEGVGGDPSSGAGYFAVARSGTLAFVPGGLEQGGGLLAVLDRQGEARRLPLGQQGLHHPRFSPDGAHLAYVVGVGTSGAGGDVWVHSLATESLTRLTFGGQAAYPLWTPDGRSLTYNDSREGAIVMKSADGSGAIQELTPPDPTPLLPESWTRDGRTLAYTRLGPSTDVYLLEEGREARLFEQDASGPVFSPDGRWIAYSQPASGNSSVFVRPISGEGKWQVSPGFGGYPRWRGDGRELYYIALRDAGRPVMAVEVRPGETFQPGPPRLLFGDLPIFRYLTSTAPFVNWDASPDGDAFVFVDLEHDQAETSRVEVAVGWAQQLGSTDSALANPGE